MTKKREKKGEGVQLHHQNPKVDEVTRIRFTQILEQFRTSKDEVSLTMRLRGSSERKTKEKREDEDEVEQMLRAAQNEILLNLSRNSHIASASPSSTNLHPDPDPGLDLDLDLDLDRPFQALKTKSKDQKPVEPDLSTRFAALKGKSHNPVDSTASCVAVLGLRRSSCLKVPVSGYWRWRGGNMEAAGLTFLNVYLDLPNFRKMVFDEMQQLNHSFVEVDFRRKKFRISMRDNPRF